MIISSKEIIYKTKHRQKNYLLFLHHFQSCIDAINDHKQILQVDVLSNADKDDIELREMIFGEGYMIKDGDSNAET